MTAFLPASWPAPKGVHAVTTLRYGLGVSQAPFDTFNLGGRCGDDPQAVAENRRQLEVALSLPAAPCWLRQVHGVGVVRLNAPHPPSAPSPRTRGEGEEARDSFSPMQQREGKESRHPFSPMERGVGVAHEDYPFSPFQRGEGARRADEGQTPEADAAVTSLPGTVLAILTADCLPVVIAAKDGSEIAAAHAGWRGLCAGVLEATVAAMHTPGKQLMAWLGPAAGASAYEVGRDVFDAFMRHDARAHLAFIATRPGHWRVDLPMLARQRLLDAGITDVYGGEHCTISNSTHFFSHRRDGQSGRIATLAWLAP